MKTIALVFGEMGAGKSYLAQKFANAHDFTFIEGDALLPVEMAERVARFKGPDAEMLEDLVWALRISGAALSRASARGIVISQALYRDCDRKKIIDFWKRSGFFVDTYWVRAPFWKNLRQLWSRERGLRWIWFWLKSKLFFQKPTHSHEVWDNE